jgi:hypothetical protein
LFRALSVFCGNKYKIGMDAEFLFSVWIKAASFYQTAAGKYTVVPARSPEVMRCGNGECSKIPRLDAFTEYLPLGAGSFL